MCCNSSCGEPHRMGRTLGLFVLCAVVLLVQPWPGEGDLGTDFDFDETKWRTDTENTQGAAAASDEEKREKRQDSNEGDVTNLKNLAIEKALTARKIPPTHKGKINIDISIQIVISNPCLLHEH